MTTLGILLVTVGLMMVILSRAYSTPPFSYLGLPGIIFVLAGIAIIASAGFSFQESVPPDWR